MLFFSNQFETHGSDERWKILNLIFQILQFSSEMFLFCERLAMRKFTLLSGICLQTMILQIAGDFFDTSF